MSTINLAHSSNQIVAIQTDEFKVAGPFSVHPQKREGTEDAKKKVKANLEATFQSRFAYVTSKVFEVVRKVADTAYQVFATSYEMMSASLLQMRNLLHVTKMFEIALLPFIAVNLAKHINQLVHGNRDVRIDSSLSIADEVGTLGGSLTTFTMGLAAIGTVSARVLQWASPLYLVSSVLSASTAMRNFRQYSKLKSLKQEIQDMTHLQNAEHKTTLDDFRAVLDLFNKKEAANREFTQNAFHRSSTQLATALHKIEKEASEKLASSDPKEQVAGSQLLNGTLKSLVGKVDRVGKTSCLAGIVSIISLIGAVVLFASPCAPAAYAIIGLGAVINLSNLIYHKVSEYKFTHELGMSKKWYEWITC